MSAWWAYIYPTIVGRFKPTDSNVDIFVFTDNDEVKRKMMIYWSAFPLAMALSDNFELMTKKAIDTLRQKKFLVEGDRVVIVSDINPKKDREILEIREV